MHQHDRAVRSWLETGCLFGDREIFFIVTIWNDSPAFGWYMREPGAVHIESAGRREHCSSAVLQGWLFDPAMYLANCRVLRKFLPRVGIHFLHRIAKVCHPR